MSAAMTLSRASCIAVCLAAWLAAAPWLDGITPLISIPDSWTIADAVTAVATSVVAMLAAAFSALIVSDWHTDVQGHHDWAQLGLTPAHLSVAEKLAAASDIDPHYLTYTSDEALRHVFRTHHAAARIARGAPVPGRSTGVSFAQPGQDVKRLRTVDQSASKS
jgi:hypothetical protein